MNSCCGLHASGQCESGGGVTIGDAVSGGTANRVLYIDATGNVADSALFTFNGTDTFTLNGTVLSGGTFSFAADPDCTLSLSGTNELTLSTAGAARQIWRQSGVIEASAIQPLADATHDLGLSGTRWRDIFGSRNLVVSSDVDSTSIIGRVRLDSRQADGMFLSHFDQSSATAFFGFQNASGAGQVNAVAGQAIGLAIGGSTKFQVNSSGHFVCPTDNANDIGADGATRPRNIRAAGKVAVGAGSASAPTLTFDAEESTGWYNPNVGELAGGCSGSVRMRITGTGLGLNGQNPTAPQAYNITNVTTDRAFDADTVAIAELADAFGTLIADLRAVGLVT